MYPDPDVPCFFQSRLSVVRQVSFTLLLNLIVAIVILLSTRGTAGSDIWYTHLVGRPVVRSYHPRDYA